MMTNSLSPRMLLLLLPCVFAVALTGCDKNVSGISNEEVTPELVGAEEATVQLVAFQEAGTEPEKPEKAQQGMVDWANDTFHMLKGKGLTTAADAGGWLAEEYKNIDRWKYKVELIDDAPAAEATLNALGEQGWECFHVLPQGNDLVMFFKKPKRSVLKTLPAQDLMRLVPMMRGK